MPCMGPSKDDAYQRGADAYKEVLELLKTKYDVTDESIVQFGPFTQTALNRKLYDLKLAIQELCWESDCQTF